ncbi:MAG: MBL fold metallo-hydrolase [Flavobacteriaceae bacterium]
MSERTASPSRDESIGAGNRMDYNGFHSRDLGLGIHLLGGCFHASMYGREFHTHASAYLVEGENGSILVDTGHAKDGAAIEAFIRSRVGDDLTYIFPTHEEYPHAGNLDQLMRAFPNAMTVGEVRNFHLYYPWHEKDARFRQMAPGEEIDLGDRRFVVLPAVIHDLPASLWGYDTKSQTMFVSDGFAFSHTYDSECTLFTTELANQPTLNETRLVFDLALYWTKFAEKRDLVEATHRLLQDFPTRIIAPAHGNVVDDPAALSRLMDEVLLAPIPH